MRLTAGTRLGPYEIVSAIGAGGMGEVYRARDTKLHRDVAIKILPELFAADRERLGRFEREAQALAALQHPNIATIFGLEEGHGTPAIAMELVEGPTLAERIADGPLPVDEALHIARQIADALDAAHEKGIIHRDLKPANIKLTPDGVVKVLDFGLAKAAALDPLGDPAHSPTFTVAATQMGVILGTAGYMAPEQARGKMADKRADIWAFGCVLYEMLTGRQAFAADNITDIMAAVVKTDPDWNALPPDMPRVREVLRRCLEKDPKQRLRDIGDARRDLEPATHGLAAGAVPAAAVRMRSAVACCVVAAALGAIGGAGWWKASAPGEGTNPISRFAIALPADAAIDFNRPVASLAISQDGRTIVYAGAPLSQQSSVPVLGSSFTGASLQPGRARLYARRLDDLIVRPISGTENARQPFFSPDGQWIAFFVDEQLKKLPLGGGMATTIANVTGNDRDGIWCDDDTILLGGYSIARVSARGGPVQRAVTLEPGERATRPQLLADGSILFTIAPNSVTTFDEAKIAVSTPGGTRRILIEGGALGQYVPSGHLVYMRGGSIMAARMTLSPLEVIGQPVAVQTGGMFNWASADAAVALSQTGTLVYVPGGPLPIDQNSLHWIDRRGRTSSLSAVPRFYAEPHFSPQGDRIAFTIRTANDDIWVYEVERGSFTRITFTGGNNQSPVWSADGSRLVYTNDATSPNLFWRPANGGAEERLTAGAHDQRAGSVSPDGKWLAYTEQRPTSRGDIMITSIPPGETRALVATPYAERNPTFSPDGRWLAFDSDETGEREVFVIPFPGSGRKWQISIGGGVAPKWRRDGRELVYRMRDRLFTVALAPGPALNPGIPKELLRLPDRISDVSMSPDGERFIAVRHDAPLMFSELHVALNWFEELKARLK